MKAQTFKPIERDNYFGLRNAPKADTAGARFL